MMKKRETNVQFGVEIFHELKIKKESLACLRGNYLVKLSWRPD